jgi:predicted kinase
MLIAMTGLPASGKSTLAAVLAQALGGIVLNKDEVRSRLFPPLVLDYSSEQDDICMAAIYRAATCILRHRPRQVVIVDGRTFSRSGQLDELLAVGASLGESVPIIECVCDEDVARQRLEKDQGEHPAGNRTFALYQERKAHAEPLQALRLTLDTGKLPLDVCLQRCLDYLQSD